MKWLKSTQKNEERKCPPPSLIFEQFTFLNFALRLSLDSWLATFLLDLQLRFMQSAGIFVLHGSQAHTLYNA